MIYRIIFLWFVLFCPSTCCWAKEHFPFLGKVTSDKVSVRAGQNVNFERLDILPKGAHVIVLEEHYDWYKIQLPATAKAYVRVDYLTVIKDQVGQISGNRVNVRAGRGVNFSTVGQLEKGTYIRLMGKTDDWFQIQAPEGLYGWIHKDFVQLKSNSLPSLESLGFAPLSEVAVQEPEQGALEGQAVASAVLIDGVLQAIPSELSPTNVKYQVTADDGVVYDLRIDPSILKNFMRARVHLQGRLVSGSSLTHPIVLVNQIKLVL